MHTRKYNIALTPVAKSQTIIDRAKKLSSIAGQYILGENSLPHVTLCQFESDENGVESLWNQVCAALEQKSIELTFSRFSYFTGDQLSWISLLPVQAETLQQLHETVANIIKNPVNRSFENYDPHMTLINTNNVNYQTEAQKELTETDSHLSDTFVLSLGTCDELGQFTRLIHSCEVKSTHSIRM